MLKGEKFEKGFPGSKIHSTRSWKKFPTWESCHLLRKESDTRVVTLITLHAHDDHALTSLVFLKLFRQLRLPITVSLGVISASTPGHLAMSGDISDCGDSWGGYSVAHGSC